MADNDDAVLAEEAASSTIEKAAKLLGPFLAANPLSSLGLVADMGDAPGVRTPWGDESLAIILPDDDSELASLASILNAIVLPERLSAIWHSEENSLEVIWTAYQLSPSQKEIDGRKFTFTHNRVSYECEFGDSSATLIALAEHTVPTSMSETNWRNIHSFSRFVVYQNREDKEEHLFDIDKPRSFWIRNFDATSEECLQILHHLNFYMTYHDDRSPYVTIHKQEPPSTIKPRTRYVTGEFPKTISSRPLDDILMNFWIATLETRDVLVRYLYCFRIIEYASFFHLEASSKSAVRKILSAPDILDNIPSATERLISALNETKLDDYTQFIAIVKDTVDAKRLWREMLQNIDAFCEETNFDGGFKLPAIVAQNCSEEQFIVRGVENFAKSIRDIRNALSHGRDKKSTSVITATQGNINRLGPWLNLIQFAAGEVLLYKDVA